MDIVVERQLDCQRERWMHSACAGEQFYKEYRGKKYCILHYPGQKDAELFNSTLQRRLKNEQSDFSGVWFSEPLKFMGHKFIGGKISFYKATFSREVDLSNVEFGDEKSLCHAAFFLATFHSTANFTRTKFFGIAGFDQAVFKKPVTFSRAEFRFAASFQEASFNMNVDFRLARFVSSNFQNAKFNKELDFTVDDFGRHADFSDAVFGDRVKFATTVVATKLVESLAVPPIVHRTGEISKDCRISLQRVIMDKPERVSFEALYLRPHWFVNIDVRRISFINVRWENNLRQELGNMRLLDGNPYRLLSKTYRELAVNAEENHRYSEASQFRHAAMNLLRKERWKGWAFWTLDWWYWLLSGYGERAGLATFWLLFIIAAFGLLYMRVGFVREPALVSDIYGMPLPLERAFTYSLAVMSLQKPEPHPLTPIAKFLVTLESILGPFIATLLALAIRRKFMRP